MADMHWVGLAVLVAIVPTAARAEGTPAAPARAVLASDASPQVDVAPGPAPSVALAIERIDAPVQTSEATGGASGFLRDVWSDYRQFVSVETAEWLAVGGVAALAMHGADEAIREELQDPEASLTQAMQLDGGAQYGNLSAQVPLAIAWWTIGHAVGSTRGAAAGRDLVRAQISALSWTYALKYSVDRTRPNGDARSFPSGHASAAFATAMVLQSHYGWKVGLPVFAAATYTAASRLTVNKHWASDVTFGAVVGMTCGRAVTVRLRGTRLAVVPQVVPGGGGVLLTTMRRPS
jgi:membrane-associated phospholipid phosphatase